MTEIFFSLFVFDMVPRNEKDKSMLHCYLLGFGYILLFLLAKVTKPLVFRFTNYENIILGHPGVLIFLVWITLYCLTSLVIRANMYAVLGEQLEVLEVKAKLLCLLLVSKFLWQGGSLKETKRVILCMKCLLLMSGCGN